MAAWKRDDRNDIIQRVNALNHWQFTIRPTPTHDE